MGRYEVYADPSQEWFDAQRLVRLYRDLREAESASCNAAQWGSADEKRASFAREDAIRARIREAKQLADSPDFWADLRDKDEDWIAL
jgi:hypothetical protein